MQIRDVKGRVDPFISWDQDAAQRKKRTYNNRD